MNRNFGFTLIELVIVVAIISMLVAIVLPFVHAMTYGTGRAGSTAERTFSVPVRGGGFYAHEIPSIITIDNCEYFYLPVNGYPGYVLTHKGDCVTCRDIMTDKIKEVLNAGKAEATDTR